MSDGSTEAVSAPPRAVATPPPAAGWERALEAIGDRLNPILVKETRQALKSRQFTLWFALLLAACWVTTIGAIALVGPSIYYISSGPYLLRAYYAVLALPLVVVAPFSAYRSLAAEHEENTRDLLEVSSLTPRQLVNGKLGSAALQVMIFASALAPAIAFTYLLRGIDALAIVVVLAYVGLASLGLSTLGLVLALLTKERYAQVVISVVWAGALFAAYVGLMEWGSVVLRADAAELYSWRFWSTHAYGFALYATTVGVAYAGATSLADFASSNRATPVRRALFVQQAVYVGCVAALVAGPGLSRESLVFAFVIAAAYWWVAAAFMSGESSTLSRRVRRSLPQSWLGRAFGAWFQPGGGSGLVLCLTNLLVVGGAVAAAAVLVEPGRVARGDPEGVTAAKAILLLAGYTTFYLGVGRLVAIGVRRVAHVSLMGAFLVQLLVALGGSSLPFVARTLDDRLDRVDVGVLTASSPVWTVGRLVDNRLSPGQESGLIVTVVAGAIAVWLVSLRVAGAEARQARVDTPLRVLEDERDLNPPPAAKPVNPWGDLPEAADAPGG
ncbi:MAG: hypothetical protein AAF805_00615 [Planctomycetota bacterium]